MNSPPDALLVKKLRADSTLPQRATQDSAGYDLCACISQPLTIPARGRASIPTGISVAIPQGLAGFVFGRSGLGIKHGITPSNSVGVIDADYRGELLVGLSNHSDEDYTIQPGDRIAQLVLIPVCTPAILEASELGETVRGAGGFGSTGYR